MPGRADAAPSPAEPRGYDLILRRAHVLDPGRGLDAVVDVGLRNGRIAAVRDRIGPGGRDAPVDLTRPGRYVLPGLIDLHVHTECGVATPGQGLPLAGPDQAGVQAGVITVVDAGSAGVGRWRRGTPLRPGPLGTTVLPYLNVGTNAHERARTPDVHTLDDVDRGRIIDTVGSPGGAITGLKLRLVGPVVEDRGEELIGLAKAVARDCGLPLMVHIGQPFAEPRRPPERTEAVTVHLLCILEAGDIVTHVCTPMPGGLGELSSTMRAAADAARGRGVRFDVGVGRRQFSHHLARLQREAGFYPDTVSTDLTGALAAATSLVQCMSILMAVGYGFADVVAMATVNAAATLAPAGRTSAGRLGTGQPGTVAEDTPANLTIVDLVPGTFQHTDGTGASFPGDWGIRPVLTVKDGRPIEPGPGPHPWGWLLPSPSQQKGRPCPP